MPKYVIIAGINGAGKSTIYSTGFSENIGVAAKNRINPDEEIVNFGGHYDNKEDQKKAGKISIKKLNSFLHKGSDFNQETTFSGSSEEARIKRAKSAGYRILMYYVGLADVDLAKERVKVRVAKGGHDIPEKVIERRYDKSLNNLKRLSYLIDELHIFDNTSKLLEVYWRKDKEVLIDETKSIVWLNDFSEEL